MLGFSVIYVAAVTSVWGYVDESALLQTKSIVYEHTDPQVPEYEVVGQGYCQGPSGSLPETWVKLGGTSDECKAVCDVRNHCIGWLFDGASRCYIFVDSMSNENADSGFTAYSVDSTDNTITTADGQAGQTCRRKVAQAPLVEVTGDPHMRNLNGEVFDLSREGKHVLIQIPAGSGEKLEVSGTVTAFHKERKCPTFFMTQFEMKGSMVGDESIQIVSDPDNFGVKLGAATEFLNIDSTSSTAAGVAQVQLCSEDNRLCKSTKPGRRTPNYANKLIVQLPSSITLVASNYASANPSFMNLAVSGLAAQDDVGGLLGHDDHSVVAGEPACETSSRVQKISMLQLEHDTTVGHLTL